MLKKPTLKLILGCAALTTLTACNTAVPIKDVMADRFGYMNKKFSPTALSPALTAKVPTNGQDVGFQQIVIKFDAQSEDSDGKKEKWQQQVTYINQGHGLVQQLMERSNNGIPFSLDYSLSYKGFMGLKWQAVPLRGNFTSAVYEIKDFSRFDPLPASLGQDFAIEYQTGGEAQLMNFYSFKRSCKTTTSRPAAELYGKLSGEAKLFECESISNNAVQNRTKWALLPNYGIAVLLNSTSSARKADFSIVDIQG